MAWTDNEHSVLLTFAESRPRMAKLAARFVDDADAVVDEAALIFEQMIPGLAYVDKPDHMMASALFICSINLALYLALKNRDVDLHDYGSAMLSGLARAPITPPPIPSGDGVASAIEGFSQIAEASQRSADPGEFVMEMPSSAEGDFEFGYNVTSCAICHQFSKYDAMDLVPYMCATDDVMSDKADQGLRRDGSIALGASHCDFRYQQGGEPRRLAEQYPERIRVLDEG